MYEEPPEEPAMREEEPSEFYEEVTQPQETQEEEQVLRLNDIRQWHGGDFQAPVVQRVDKLLSGR